MGRRGGEGVWGGGMGGGEREIIYYHYTVTTRMTPALRWAAMRTILMIRNCEGQSHKTVSTDHNFWRERRAEADSNRSPSAYQPNALPPGQTGSPSLSRLPDSYNYIIMQLLTFFSWPGGTLATSFSVHCTFNFISHRVQQDALFYPNSIPPNTLTDVNSSNLSWIAFREHLGPSAAEELCKYMQHKRLKDAKQKHRHARTVRLWGRARASASVCVCACVRVCMRACVRACARACVRACVWLRQRD